MMTARNLPIKEPVRTEPTWQEQVKPFRAPSKWRSIWQIVNTAVPFFAMYYVMLLSLEVSWALTWLLAIPTAGMTVRFFIISHDCGHGSFFRSQRANDIVGFWTSLMAYTPYLQWRHAHAIHHKSSGQIEARGIGYMWIMTVAEFEASAWYVRAWYRVYRNPFITFGIGGLWLFLVEYRFYQRGGGLRTRLGVYGHNLVLASVFGALAWVFGAWNVFLVQLPLCTFSGFTGVWLFWAQHHYEDAYWAPKKDWDYVRAALDGSSYLVLPRIAQWFAGNINFHHVHHLAPNIPNYNLQGAHESIPMFRDVEPLTIRDTLPNWRLRLIDQDQCKWVDFPD